MSPTCLLLTLSFLGSFQSGDDEFTKLVHSGGADAAISRFRELRRTDPKAVPFQESTMNSLGYELVGKKDFPSAIKLFGLIVEAYPRSSNAEDSLAEAYMNAGDKKSAIAHYFRSLTMQPSSERQVQILGKLGRPVSQKEWSRLFSAQMPPDIVFKPNLVYARRGGEDLRFDVVKPRARKKKLPLLVFIHGGGWSTGTKERGIFPLVYFARQGFVGASIEYRLAPRHTFPVQVQDVKAAIQFFRTHDSSLGIDPNKIAVWGQSAGGHLAAMAGTTAGNRMFDMPGASTRVQAVIDWNGPTDFLADPKSLKVVEPTANGINRFVGGALKDRKRIAKLANPIRYVSKGDAPFLIVQGTADREVIPSQSAILHQALIKHGVPSELILLKGEDHFGPEELPPGVVARLQYNDSKELAVTMTMFLRQKMHLLHWAWH